MHSLSALTPSLQRIERDGLALWTDPTLALEAGVILAFSERRGGLSAGAFSSLNLAGHVGDAPKAVDANRERLMQALGIGSLATRLVSAEQVHGDRCAVVEESDAGRGALASGGRAPVPQTDALVTSTPKLPLLLCFADCVPIVIVAPGPAVAVVHAGWRGALAGIPGRAAQRLAEHAGSEQGALAVYIGAHIGPCHYQVGEEIVSQFGRAFGTLARVPTGSLDLGAVVRMSLIDAGVAEWRITSLGVCTAEAIESFFSYRAENGITGRHGAVVCIG
jgi:hypothetical protein